ncbi:hypothetical protein Nepgr_031675 [Nepenthes gracilis]|uniref:Beta-fructofuranosidase n=1 Tax=Nepenthes gracilis TaxID=150966 RepID=A0AAD3Y512_NEPGR|nr:hypothetical protein Nepgr_031675 [Nepenthes gracilis]
MVWPISGGYSSDSDDFTAVLYSYNPLPNGRNSSSKRSCAMKIGIVVLSALPVFALFLVLSGDTKKEAIKIECNETGAHGCGRCHAGRRRGCRRRRSGFPDRGGLRAAAFEWNETQLAWQRTAYHFQPMKNWMNGPLCHKGWYHFFYQYNPNAAVWGDIVWGHAVSRDLIKWRHLPSAIVADRWYDVKGVWTGSATLLPDGQIAILYTGSTNASDQVQNLAFPADLSDDLLINWVKYSGNPVLRPPPGIQPKDFRDPSTAWYTAGKRWRFAIGSKKNRTGISLVYETEDFKSFKLLDGLLHSVAGTGMWECVDFFPVSMTDPNGMDTSARGPHVKHVLKASLDDVKIDCYAIGMYDDEKGMWVPDAPENDVGAGMRYDHGKFYASKTFYDQEKRRRVLWGWVSESDAEAVDIRKGWASLQAIPRTVLYDQKTGANLLQWPVEEIESLRTQSSVFPNATVQAGSVMPLNVGSAEELDIVAEFEISQEALEKLPTSDKPYSCRRSGGSSQRGSLGPFGLLVLTAEDFSEQTPVYFYVTRGSDGDLKTFFCTDLSRSSMAAEVIKDIYGSTVPVLRGEKLTLRVLVDHSIVEAFAQGGRTCITSRVYPTKAIYGGAKLFVFNNATEATITASIKTWQMSPARPHGSSVSDHIHQN